jgi:hypothetical protein
MAGVLLQASASGYDFRNTSHDLFSGLFRAIGLESERLVPLWTGMRHALCRKDIHGKPPYLRDYLRRTITGQGDDGRKMERVAQGIALVYAHCQHSYKETSQTPSISDRVAHVGVQDGLQPNPIPIEPDYAAGVQMLVKLFRDIGESLWPEVQKKSQRRQNAASDLPNLVNLTNEIYSLVMPIISLSATPEELTAIKNAYNICLASIAGGAEPTSPPLGVIASANPSLSSQS